MLGPVLDYLQETYEHSEMSAVESQKDNKDQGVRELGLFILENSQTVISAAWKNTRWKGMKKTELRSPDS